MSLSCFRRFLNKSDFTTKICILSLVFTMNGCSLLPVSCPSDLSLEASDIRTIKKYKKCEAVVSGLVYSTYKPQSGKVFFLNMGASDYRQAFTGVIFANNLKQFENEGIDVKELKGRFLTLRGTIEEYKGKPQIIINSPAQITVLPKP